MFNQNDSLVSTVDPSLEDFFSDLNRHYSKGFDETDKRRTGRGRIGSITFDEADELFRSWLDEKKWPYDALLFDPRVFTFIIEKTSRLLGSRLRGELVPREGADMLGAKINNALLNLQWDQANHNGSMLSKWSLMDINTRKYGAGFGLCKWMYERDMDGKVIFDGPELKILNNRDCAPDPTATTIENCNWFQVREYVTFNDLMNTNDAFRGDPIYYNLDKLEASLTTRRGLGSDYRSANWQSRNRQISKLDPTPYAGDPVFKYVEIVTEFRRDEWFTFAPKHGIVLRHIKNPYKNHEIPITMLKYYPIDDDIYGVSEIEPIKSLQKAVNALLCQYVDEINMKLYTPIAVAPSVRQHTLEWGKGAKWLMNNPMTDFRLVESSSNAAAFFNNTYSALIAAMMNAVGETSLGISNIDRYQASKTATEIKYLTQQKNARDNYNQMFLSEAIERQMMLWHSMNQTMMFADPGKKHYLIRVVGKDAIDYFKQKKLDAYGLSQAGAEIATENEDAAPEDLRAPLYPVDIGTEEEPNIVPKYSEEGGVGSLYIQPEDLMGYYDYIADVKSMALSATDDEKMSRDKAVTALLTNPNAVALLASDNTKPKFRELFIHWLEDSGFKDAERFFTSTPPATPGMPGAPTGAPGMPGKPGEELQGVPGRPPESLTQSAEKRVAEEQGTPVSPAPGEEEIEINPNPNENVLKQILTQPATGGQNG